MKDLEGFATAKLAEEGVKIPLTDVEGNETKHWIKIKSTDSISFKKAQSKFRKRIVAIHELGDEDDSLDSILETEKLSLELLACLIISWSFKNDDGTPYKCTKANAIKLLKDAPILAQEIDAASARRKNFIKRSLKESSDSQKNNLSSKKDQKAVTTAK